MKDILLILAAMISAFGFYIHVVRGGKLIVAPMLQTDLHHVSKHTLKFSWDWGAVTMVVLTLSYLAPIWRADFMVLAGMATLYGGALGVLSFLTMRREGFRVGQMPQWLAFWAASLSGLIAWGLL